MQAMQDAVVYISEIYKRKSENQFSGSRNGVRKGSREMMSGKYYGNYIRKK